jgi:rhodanese-related sulfurtransferase
MSKDVDDYLSGKMPPPAKFSTVGTTISGTIFAEPVLKQQRDFMSKQPLAWEDGTPRMQLLIPLQLDDGTKVTVYCKGQMRQAVKEALNNAGAKSPEVGGHLTVAYVGDEPVPGLTAAKVYQAEYKPPAPASGSWGEQQALDDDEPPY